MSTTPNPQREPCAGRRRQTSEGFRQCPGRERPARSVYPSPGRCGSRPSRIRGSADWRAMFPYLPQQPDYDKRLKQARPLLCKAILTLAAC